MATLDALRVFVEVVRAASFTAAARRLGISKSLASKRVAALEEQLGVSLINRSTRKLHLTEAGRIYYEHGLRIREELESAEARVQSVTSQPMGQLKVSAQVSFGFMYLAAPTTAFMRRYPDVSVEILLEDQRFEPIDESVDLAIRMGPLPDSSMVSRPLCKVVYGLYAAPDYLARVNAPPVQPQDIRAFDTIFYGNYDLGAHWRFTLNGQPFDVEPESRLVINNLLGVVEASVSPICRPSRPARQWKVVSWCRCCSPTGTSMARWWCCSAHASTCPTRPAPTSTSSPSGSRSICSSDVASTERVTTRWPDRPSRRSRRWRRRATDDAPRSPS